MFLFLFGFRLRLCPNYPVVIIVRSIAGLGCAGLVVACLLLFHFPIPPTKGPIVLNIISAVGASDNIWLLDQRWRSLRRSPFIHSYVFQLLPIVDLDT
jgi:hypothetical protein